MASSERAACDSTHGSAAYWFLKFLRSSNFPLSLYLSHAWATSDRLTKYESHAGMWKPTFTGRCAATWAISSRPDVRSRHSPPLTARSRSQSSHTVPQYSQA